VSVTIHSPRGKGALSFSAKYPLVTKLPTNALKNLPYGPNEGFNKAISMPIIPLPGGMKSWRREGKNR
jgi:hypothetical protein